MKHENAIDGILLAGERLLEFSKNLTKQEFDKNWEKQVIAERLLEIISEAARKLDEKQMDKYPIPWKNIFTIGNIIRHEYNAVDYDILWMILQDHIPPLLEAVKKMIRNSISLEAHQALIGKELGVSGWVHVTQDMIDKFADCTLDHQFIHVDVERAKKETPFGGTIAHGFLSVSLLSHFAYEVVPGIDGMINALNYGFDKLRFMSPVKAGKRVRARFTLSDLQMRSEKMVQRTLKTVVEIEGEEKPALMAEWLGVIVLK